MKNGLLASALCLVSAGAVAADLPARAPAMAPAPVANSFDAFGSLSLGYNQWNEGEHKPDGLNLNARATFAAPLMGNFGFQADGVFARSVYADSDEEVKNHSSALTGHVFMRDSSVGLVGVIAQAVSNNSSYSSSREYYLGAEAQYFLGPVTLYGQAAYQNYSFPFYPSSIAADGWVVAGQARMFATPNWMFALKASYSALSSEQIDGFGIDHSAWLVGVKSEYRFDASPISAFAELDYRSGKFKVAGNADFVEKETRAMVGVKWNFGTQTLIQRDRSGASLDPIKSLMSPILYVQPNT
ncbi:MAG: hypothetical protein JWN93_1700 [Hyphomicrobiales bacterium]|nr:hypothetical protein [Hyphomicrobiales bacterium]